jgi:sugar (pentulose or hexulose) kinase
MPEHVLAFDLETGSSKACMWKPDGTCLVERAHAYETVFTPEGGQEQRPEDCWQAIASSTRDMLAMPVRSMCCAHGDFPQFNYQTTIEGPP